MAKLNGPFSFTGPLAGVTAYTRKDVEGTLLRSETSLDKERIYSDPAFTNTVRHATEKGGRSKGAWWLRRVLHPLEPVRDGNWQGRLTGALTPLQRADSEGVYGQRRLLFSRYGSLLQGFCLSPRTPFEQLLRSSPVCSLDKDALSARLELPALAAGVNFTPRTPLPYFRVVTVLGVVPDLFFHAGAYAPQGDYRACFPEVAYSDWRPVKGGAPALNLELALPQQPPNGSFALVLALGLSFGAPDPLGSIQAVGYSGSGRIVEVG